jgi:hypothetical protein
MDEGMRERERERERERPRERKFSVVLLCFRTFACS